MPGLIHRCNAVAEYSALMSTKPTSPKRSRRDGEADLTTLPHPRSTRASIREEASEWYEAIAPPLEDLQAVIRRMRADPDLTQDRAFAHLCPAAVLCALFAVALVAVREGSFVHRVLDAPSPASDGLGTAAARFAALAVCAVVVSVVSLKCVIFVIAEACAIVASMETRERMRAREDRGMPTSGLVLGGMWM